MSVSENIKKLRKEKGLSQQALADAIYVSRSAVAKWENGNGLPSEANLAQMASYFKVMQSEITGEQEEWDKEVEHFKKVFRELTIRACIIIFTILMVLGFITYLLFNIPSIKKDTLTEVETTLGQSLKIQIVKEAGPFTSGEVCIYDYSGDELSDDVVFKNGALNHKYRVTLMNVAWIHNTTLYVPQYATIFECDFAGGSDYYSGSMSSRSVMAFEKITVSPYNKTYDSRNDCNCLIETSTNKLLLGCPSSVIPNDVTEIGDYAFYNVKYTPETLTIPGTIKKLGYNAFSYDYWRENWDESKPVLPISKIVIEEGVTELEQYCFDGFYATRSYVLPSTIKKMDYLFATTIVGTAYENPVMIYYSGSKKEFLEIEFTYEMEYGTYDDTHDAREKEYQQSLLESDSFYNMKVCYYSYYEPVNKENLWHYDADGNPVLWSEDN